MEGMLRGQTADLGRSHRYLVMTGSDIFRRCRNAVIQRAVARFRLRCRLTTLRRSQLRVQVLFRCLSHHRGIHNIC